MESKYIAVIAKKLSLSLKQVNNVYDLQAEGATVPFMARYRKEATGNLDEVAINDIVEEVKYYTELHKRKDTVLKTIEGLGVRSMGVTGNIGDRDAVARHAIGIGYAAEGDPAGLIDATVPSGLRL